MTDAPAVVRKSAAGPAGVVIPFLVLTIGALPPVLLGGLAIPMSHDLQLDVRSMGIAVAAFWFAAGVFSTPAGRVGDRRGWVPVAYVGLATTATAALLMTVLHSGGWPLVATMAVAGGGLAACSQSSNLALVAQIDPEHLGRAFGIKQSAPAAAWLLAGLAMPLVAAVWGWKPVWWALLAMAPLVAVLVGRTSRHARRLPPAARRENETGSAATDPGRPRLPLVIAFGLGTATISALTTFGLSTLVHSGLTASRAGYAVALAGGLALAGRVAAGSWLDRGEPTMRIPAWLLVATTCGLALLAIDSPATAVVGLIVALACGSGWPPVVLALIVRTWADAPGKATGVTAVGAAAGSIIGPLVFSSLASTAGPGRAWLALSLMAAAAASMMLVPLHSTARRDAVQPQQPGTG